MYDENRGTYKAKYEAFDKALELMTPSIVDPQPDDSRELDHSVIKMSDQEEPISEDLLDEIHNRWEDDPHTKWPKCPYKDFKNIACHFANWQKEQYINEGISPKDAYFGHLLEESWANSRLSGIHEFKQQMIKDAKLSGWVARDDDGHLHLFEVEPRRIEGNHRWWDRDYHRTTLDDCDFPDLKWKDEPVYVKLIIIKEE